MAIYQGNKKVANNYYIDNTVYCVPIGTIISYTSTIPPTGFLVCDGSEISKTDYADLYKVIGDKFGTATNTAKFKLPDLRDKFVQGANDNVGTNKDAGLPNISGKVGYLKSVNEGNYYQGINTSNGCFNQSANVITSPPAATTQFNGGTDSKGATGLIRFNASDSNPIYGNSNTVQPPAVCLTYIIKSTKLSDIPIETSGIIDDNSTGEDRTWSASKIRNSTIPYVLIDTTKDIDFDEYVETGYYTPNKSFSTGWFTHSILNAPTNGWLPAGGFGLEVKTFDNTSSAKWFTQVLYSYVGTDNNSAPIYSRTFFYDEKTTTFSPWKRIADIDDSVISSDETWSSQKINEECIKVHRKNTSITTAVYQWFAARYDSQTKQVSITIPITIANDVSNVSLDFGDHGILLHIGSDEVEQYPTQVSAIGIEDSKSLGLLRFDMKVDSGDTSINCIAIPSGTTITFS